MWLVLNHECTKEIICKDDIQIRVPKSGTKRRVALRYGVQALRKRRDRLGGAAAAGSRCPPAVRGAQGSRRGRAPSTVQREAEGEREVRTQGRRPVCGGWRRGHEATGERREAVACRGFWSWVFKMYIRVKISQSKG